MLGSSGLAEGSPARCLRRAHHTKDSNACGALWREQAGLSTYSAVELEQIPAVHLIPINHPVFLRPAYNIGCLHESAGRAWRNVMDTHCLFPESTGFDRYGGKLWRAARVCS
jgi:hypothetical protein